MRATTRAFLFGLCVSLSAILGQAEQSPFSFETFEASSSDTFNFSHPIRRVAVIGAGPSGLQAASALIEQGFEVRLFERTKNPGGNWHYNEAAPIPANFP